MKGNVIVGQSGGPTAAINSSLAGVYRTAKDRGAKKVYGMLHGVQGLLQERYIDLSEHIKTELDAELLKRTPAAFLGSCRYKLPEIHEDKAVYEKIFKILDKLDIEAFIYIGGNDSMDTVDALAEWAAENAPSKRFIGIPKTVDNDLVPVDHCPGFPSAAKVACQITHATRLDYDAYTRPEVFVLEVMGRDAGWLAASCCITGDVDLLVLPEVAFDRDAFLAEVRAKFEATGSCYIVVSEGARYADGTYLSAGDTAHDGFAHAVLGGAAQTIKQMIVDAGIVPRGVVQDLSRAARSSNFAQSLVDVTEAYDLGMSAHMRSADPAFTGQVVGIRRNPEAAAEGRYEAELFAGPASEFANFVKRFPAEWILPNYQGITPEAVAYFRPLIEGEPKLVMKGGIPATIVPFNKR